MSQSPKSDVSDLTASWLPVNIPTNNMENIIQSNMANISMQLDNIQKSISSLDERLTIVESVTKETLRSVRQSGLLSRAQLPLQGRVDTSLRQREINLALRQHVPVPFAKSSSGPSQFM
jgi:hypothetical protein